MPTQKKNPEPEIIDVPADPAQEPTPDAVIVFKITDEEGNISTEVQPLGSVQLTEIQTLLELGVQGFRERVFGQSGR